MTTYHNSLLLGKLDDDETKDIFFFGIPNSWQKQMILQDFDPLDHTLEELVDFCESKD